MPCFPTLLPGKLLLIPYNLLQGHLLHEALPNATRPSPSGWPSMVSHTHTRTAPSKPITPLLTATVASERCHVGSQPQHLSSPFLTQSGRTSAALTCPHRLQLASWCRFQSLSLGYQSSPITLCWDAPGTATVQKVAASAGSDGRNERHATCRGERGQIALSPTGKDKSKTAEGRKH